MPGVGEFMMGSRIVYNYFGLIVCQKDDWYWWEMR